MPLLRRLLLLLELLLLPLLLRLRCSSSCCCSCRRPCAVITAAAIVEVVVRRHEVGDVDERKLELRRELVHLRGDLVVLCVCEQGLWRRRRVGGAERAAASAAQHVRAALPLSNLLTSLGAP